jgi:hypothetical protein
MLNPTTEPAKDPFETLAAMRGDVLFKRQTRQLGL